MLISVDLLNKYTGSYNDDDDLQTELNEMYIGSAQAEIVDYLGYNPEETEELSDFALLKIKNVCLEIAALIAMEAGNNLGINTSSGADGIASRTFLNVVDYSKYLSKLSAYRKNTEM